MANWHQGWLRYFCEYLVQRIIGSHNDALHLRCGSERADVVLDDHVAKSWAYSTRNGIVRCVVYRHPTSEATKIGVAAIRTCLSFDERQAGICIELPNCGFRGPPDTRNR